MAGWDHEIYFRSRSSTQHWPTDASLRSHFMQDITLLVLRFFCSSENGCSGIRRNLQRAAFCLATKSYYSGVITLPISLVKHIYQWYLLPIKSICTLIIQFQIYSSLQWTDMFFITGEWKEKLFPFKVLFCCSLLALLHWCDCKKRKSQHNAWTIVFAPEVRCSCNLQQPLFACLPSLCCQLSQHPITETDPQRLFSNLSHLLQSSS